MCSHFTTSLTWKERGVHRLMSDLAHFLLSSPKQMLTNIYRCYLFCSESTLHSLPTCRKPPLRMMSNTCPFRRTDICPARTGVRCTEWDTGTVWCHWRFPSRFHDSDRTLHIYLRTRGKSCKRCRALTQRHIFFHWVSSGVFLIKRLFLLFSDSV